MSKRVAVLGLFAAAILAALSGTVDAADRAVRAYGPGVRAAGVNRPVIVGTPNAVADIVGRYRDAGAGELIIPDFTLGPMTRRKDTLDLFMEEVVPQLG